VSPCERIALPKKDRHEVVPLAVEAVERLVASMPDRYRALVVVAAGAGLRQGEAFGLTVDRVDFLRRELRVDRQLVAVRDGVPELGPTKTPAGLRTVPVPTTVVDVLASHLARHRPSREGLIFTNTYRRPLQRSAFGSVWRRVAREAELPESATFHDLRHFYASLLIARGCSIKAVQKRLGHQSAVETLDTYSHLWPDSDDETRDAVESVLSSIAI
jgi:integrase